MTPCTVRPWLFVALTILTSKVAGDDRPVEDAHQFSAAQLEFFEKKIRPVLVQECYQCHSAKAARLQGGLFLDSREGILQGGDTGPAVVVGKPEESLLMGAIRHESLEMPPEKQLAGDIVADLEQWIRTGLADPRKRSEATAQPLVLYTREASAAHWSFQPLVQPSVPETEDPWIRTPIDAFILGKLRAAGLEPSATADRRTLLRRAFYDLTGLPPALRDVEQFESEDSAEAFAHQIDRLLESPRYGEKWARHWLDIARYSDTNGQRPAPTPDAPFYPFAWVYRDYVIDAFNRDLPFDQFIIEQLAGDTLATDSDRRPLAALGFLRVGKTFGGNLDDRIDDRIDATTRGLLGLTVSCARCHDHKLEPIYQSDYYALHGVFASSQEFDALYEDTSGTPEYADYIRQKTELAEEIESECLQRLNEFMHGLTLQVSDYLVGVEKYRDGELREHDPALAAREVGLQPIPFKAWLNATERWVQQETSLYLPWFAFAELGKREFAERSALIAREVASGSMASQRIPQLVAKRFEQQNPTSLREVADIYQTIFLDVEREANGQYPMAALLCAMKESPGLFRDEFYQHPALPPPLEDAQLEALRTVTLGFDGPFFMTPRQLMQSGASGPRKAMVRRRHELTRLEAEHPGAPIRAMGLRDVRPVNSPVFIRGDKNLPGEVVPRRFLQRLSRDQVQPFTRGSGRFELASAIASASNPLTARVITNRVWQWHFGRGLVSTPSDFGLNGERPTHPELLDWLANWFIQEGWSIKKLNRLIMTSSVYQQKSQPRDECSEVDSENRLLWRMTPRRLDFEEMRDTWLTAAGTIEHKLGGRPVDPLTDKGRRSVYVSIDRYNLPQVFSTFDFASPEFTTAQRDSTIVPQQALFVMNSRWLIERARDFVSRRDVVEARTLEQKVDALYAILYQRRPDPTELSLALRFVQSLPNQHRQTALERLGHALLQTSETIHVP